LKLQKAFARAIKLMVDPAISAGEIQKIGLQDFRAEFGYEISARHWRRLLSRTIERDCGQEHWERLEIYLDDRACVAPKPSREIRQTEYLHRDLDETIEALDNRLNPTLEDKKYLWDAVFRHYENLTDRLTDSPSGNRKRRRLKKSLVHYLAKAFPPGSLSKSANGVRHRLDEKLRQWREGGRSPETLQDRRPLDSGNFCESDFTEDLKKIRNKAIELGGSESLAHRMLRETGELSNEFCEHYPYVPRMNKSDLPKLVRKAITPEVNMCLPLLHGPWEAKMCGPYTPRAVATERRFIGEKLKTGFGRRG
jgi:hypothetical protein